MTGSAAAYDALAARYDAVMEPSRWARAELHRDFTELLSEAKRVIDFGAGTGLDTAHLLRLGLKVAAVDTSAGMLRELERRHLSSSASLECHGSLDQLAGQWDGMVSSFAALNTVDDLPSWVEQSARLLRPGAPLCLHVLNRWSMPRVWADAKGLRLRTAAAGLVRGRRSFSLEGVHVPHHLFNMHELQAVLTPYFKVCHWRAVGLLWPPPNSARWAGLERRLGGLPAIRSLGEFLNLHCVRSA